MVYNFLKTRIYSIKIEVWERMKRNNFYRIKRNACWPKLLSYWSEIFTDHMKTTIWPSICQNFGLIARKLRSARIADWKRYATVQICKRLHGACGTAELWLLSACDTQSRFRVSFANKHFLHFLQACDKHFVKKLYNYTNYYKITFFDEINLF